MSGGSVQGHDATGPDVAGPRGSWWRAILSRVTPANLTFVVLIGSKAWFDWLYRPPIFEGVPLAAVVVSMLTIVAAATVASMPDVAAPGGSGGRMHQAVGAISLAGACVILAVYLSALHCWAPKVHKEVPRQTTGFGTSWPDTLQPDAAAYVKQYPNTTTADLILNYTATNPEEQKILRIWKPWAVSLTNVVLVVMYVTSSLAVGIGYALFEHLPPRWHHAIDLSSAWV